MESIDKHGYTKALATLIYITNPAPAQSAASLPPPTPTNPNSIRPTLRLEFTQVSY